MAITPLSVPPSKSDPANFNTRADTFLGELPTFATEANALATDVNSKQLAAALSETNAAASALAASGSATAASNSASDASTYATNASNSATSALNAPGTNATSTNSLTIGTGNKTLTIQTGKAFSIGQRVVIAYSTTPTISMTGVITTHNSGTGSLTVSIESTSGAGTYTAWTVSLSATAGVLTVNGQSGHITDIATKAGTETLTNKTISSSNVLQNVQVISANTDALVGNSYVMTTNLILTLPLSPSVGDWVKVQNASGTSTCTVARNGNNIMSLAEDMVIEKINAGVTNVYADSTSGWLII
jgi:hypothetical protein